MSCPDPDVDEPLDTPCGEKCSALDQNLPICSDTGGGRVTCKCGSSFEPDSEYTTVCADPPPPSPPNTSNDGIGGLGWGPIGGIAVGCVVIIIVSVTVYRRAYPGRAGTGGYSIQADAVEMTEQGTEPTGAAVSPAHLCSGCGAQRQPGARFCNGCGIPAPN
jgi:hypothetical protein